MLKLHLTTILAIARNLSTFLISKTPALAKIFVNIPNLTFSSFFLRVELRESSERKNWILQSSTFPSSGSEKYAKPLNCSSNVSAKSLCEMVKLVLRTVKKSNHAPP